MARKESIRWDETEKDALAQQIALLRISDVDSTLTGLLNKAQDVLPLHRRRGKLASFKLVPGLDTQVKRHLDTLLNKPVRTEIQYVKTDADEAVKAATLGQLIDETITRISRSITQQLTEVLTTAINARHVKPQETVIEHSEVEKAKGPVVAVVGMYLPNFRALENRLKTKLSDVRLRFVDTSKSQVAFPMSTDFVVCVGNKLPHNWYDAARSKFGDKCLHVEGRVQQAEKAILAYMSNGGKVHYRRDVVGDMQ